MGVQPSLRTILAGSIAATVIIAGCTVQTPTQGDPKVVTVDKITEKLVNDPKDAEKIAALEGDLASRKTALDKANQDIAGLQAQLSGMAPTSIVQVGNTTTSTSSAQPSGWDTAASVAAGIKEVWEDNTTYKTASAQWDVTKSDVVYFTSMGTGYAGYTSATYKTAGVQLIDANTYETIAVYDYDLSKVAPTAPHYVAGTLTTPHGLGVSPDGTQLYIPTGDGGAGPWATKKGSGMILVADAKTGALRQVIKTGVGVHHIKAFVDYQGNHRIILELSSNGTVLLDPNDDNRVVKFISMAETQGRSYQSNAAPGGKYLWLNSRSILGHDYDASANIKWDLSNDSRKAIWSGKSPNGIGFSANGGWTYMIDSVGNQLIKVDNSTDKYVAETQTGSPGAYNIQLNWDNSLAFLTGKGESTFNLGRNVSVINLRTFRAIDEVYIAGQTIDHIILNPIREKNEFWVSSSGTYETIVMSAAAPFAVKQRIKVPTTGDTHSGAFIKYKDKDYTKGELQADQGGVWGDMLAQMKAEAASASPPIPSNAAGVK